MDIPTLLRQAHEFTQSPFELGQTLNLGVTLTRKFLETSNPTEKILYSSFESSSTPPHSNLIICHGGFEHSGRYDFLAYTLACRGYLCHSLDLRGQGRSDGLRCGTKKLVTFHEDLSLLLHQIPNHLPIYIFAHSMGGGIFTTFLLKNPALFTHIRGVIFSGPLTKMVVPDMPLNSESDLKKLSVLEIFFGHKYSGRVKIFFVFCGLKIIQTCGN